MSVVMSKMRFPSNLIFILKLLKIKKIKPFLLIRYESNAEVTLQLAQLTADHGGPLSCLQTKITAIINPDLMVTY